MNQFALMPLNTTDQASVDFFSNLYLSAFPEEERRPLDSELNLAFLRTDLYADLIVVEQRPVGLITYWSIKEVLYVEHFAVSPDLRGGGIGSKTIHELYRKMGKGILLEVEPPTTNDARRRIEFYERMGFVLHDAIDYSQPAYGPCLPAIPMRLMTLSIDHFVENHQSIIRELSEKVYRCIGQTVDIKG